MSHQIDHTIKICNLQKSFKEKEVLRGINLLINSNSIIGLIGDNGAGKTTLIKCLCRLIEPSDGTIEFYGAGKKESEAYIRENVGVLLEGARNLYNFLTVEENLSYFGNLNNISKIDIEQRSSFLLKKFNLEKHRKTTVNELSRGMQQKVAIMVILMKDPQIMILDEPTLGLDLVSTIKMIDLLKSIVEEGKTIIIISHDMSLIKRLCQRVIFLKDGMIEFDEPLTKFDEEQTFSIQVKAEKAIISILEEKSIHYELDDGIAIIETHNLKETIESLPSESILSIEKSNDTLEKYIKERMGSCYA